MVVVQGISSISPGGDNSISVTSSDTNSSDEFYEPWRCFKWWAARMGRPEDRRACLFLHRWWRLVGLGVAVVLIILISFVNPQTEEGAVLPTITRTIADDGSGGTTTLPKPPLLSNHRL